MKKFKVTIENERWTDDLLLKITTNGWQSTGIYLSLEQIQELRDYLNRYTKENPKAEAKGSGGRQDD